MRDLPRQQERTEPAVSGDRGDFGAVAETVAVIARALERANYIRTLHSRIRP